MLRLTMAATVLAVALGACSDGSTTAPESTAPPATPPPATTPASSITSASSATPTTPPSSTTTIQPTTSTTGSAPTTTAAAEPWHVPGRRYYFPVQPPDVADYGADHHDYPATDIFAPRGSQLVAVTDGVVDEVGRTDGWDPATDDPATRGGRYVSIIGSDGARYYYSHLETVSKQLDAGTAVHAGAAIGTVGTSGNARETPPHVHFGISHPTFPGDWEMRRGEVWPYDYLESWAAGRDLVPEL